MKSYHGANTPFDAASPCLLPIAHPLPQIAAFPSALFTYKPLNPTQPNNPACIPKVPALDNGEFYWGLYALREALLSIDAKLAARILSYMQTMEAAARDIFLAGPGQVRWVAVIDDPTLPPSQGSYQGDADPGDPYEGEMFTWLMDLKSVWHNDTEREYMWIAKRPNLAAVNFTSTVDGAAKYDRVKKGHRHCGVLRSLPLYEDHTLNPSPSGSPPRLSKRLPINRSSHNITVQRGFWFSSHEQWKVGCRMAFLQIFAFGRRPHPKHHSQLLFLPYRDSSVAKRIFDNCERARTHYSVQNKVRASFFSFIILLTRTSKSPTPTPLFTSLQGPGAVRLYQ